MREINFVFHNKDFVYFEYPDRKIKGFQNVIRSFDQEWMQSKKFIDWISSIEGKQLINNFKIKGKQLFFSVD